MTSKEVSPTVVENGRVSPLALNLLHLQVCRNTDWDRKLLAKPYLLGGIQDLRSRYEHEWGVEGLDLEMTLEVERYSQVRSGVRVTSSDEEVSLRSQGNTENTSMRDRNE